MVGEFTAVIGKGLTVIVAEVVPVQPAIVPVTVYVVVVVGETDSGLAVDPVFQR